MNMRPCPCGSGLDSTWQKDARGIELCRTCPKCHREKMSRYRPDVLNDASYWHDEPIDDDDGTSGQDRESYSDDQDRDNYSGD